MLKDLKRDFFDNANIVTRLISINIVIYILFYGAIIIPTWFGLIQYGSSIELGFDLFSVPLTFQEFIYRPWTIITYQFIHGDIMHILMNLLILYWFGQMLINFLNKKQILGIYLTGGIAGGLIYLIAMTFLPVFQGRVSLGMVGASASIMAILFAMATLRPSMEVKPIFFPPIQLKYIALALLIIDYLGTVQTNAGGAFAHIGGASFGVLYIKQLQQGRDLGKWTYFIGDLFKKRSKTKMKIVHKSKTSVGKKFQNQEDKLNHILDKISQSGYGSLTSDEKDFLNKTSKH